mmetsp:Transcript_35185/g.93610  ORF Transcript_35185/g.93610 Transcript_35185/m.93610 type:complete len:251 (+) Transcript_35185:109-861(+)
MLGALLANWRRRASNNSPAEAPVWPEVLAPVHQAPAKALRSPRSRLDTAPSNERKNQQRNSSHRMRHPPPAAKSPLARKALQHARQLTTRGTDGGTSNLLAVARRQSLALSTRIMGRGSESNTSKMPRKYPEIYLATSARSSATFLPRKSLSNLRKPPSPSATARKDFATSIAASILPAFVSGSPTLPAGAEAEARRPRPSRPSSFNFCTSHSLRTPSSRVACSTASPSARAMPRHSRQYDKRNSCGNSL